jgi:hypothetical protein
MLKQVGACILLQNDTSFPSSCAEQPAVCIAVGRGCVSRSRASRVVLSLAVSQGSVIMVQGCPDQPTARTARLCTQARSTCRRCKWAGTSSVEPTSARSDVAFVASALQAASLVLCSIWPASWRHVLMMRPPCRYHPCGCAPPQGPNRNIPAVS